MNTAYEDFDEPCFCNEGGMIIGLSILDRSKIKYEIETVLDHKELSIQNSDGDEVGRYVLHESARNLADFIIKQPRPSAQLTYEITEAV